MNLAAIKNEVACFGEMLWDVLPGCELPGGAPFNVAYHLKKLGIEPLVISRIGKDKRGFDLLDKLTGSDINLSRIQIDEIYETGWVHAKRTSNTEMEYDIVHPVAWDFIEWDNSFIDLISSCRYLVFGSLASRNDVSRETLYTMLELPVKKVLDVNLRPPHYDKQGIEYLLNKADILKLNEAELSYIAGWNKNKYSPEEVALSIQNNYAIPTLIITLGSKGAVVLNEGKFYRHPGFTVKVSDTIGSGDSFLAGFLSQLLRGSNITTALEFSCAIGALIATLPGGCPNYSTINIQQLLAGDDLQIPSIFF
jgi:fructokinase